MLKKLLKYFLPINLEEMRAPGFLDKRAKEIGLCVDNVKSRSGLYEVEKCPLCGSPDREEIFSRFNLAVVQCENCTVGYMKMFPVDTEDVYSNEHYIDIAQSDYLDNVDYRKKRFGKERIQLIRRHINSTQNAGHRLLDSGCGTGWFLEVAREHGFDIAGQEFGKDLARYTSEKLGIKVWNCPIFEIPLHEKFDVITLFDVIEHVPDPVKVLKSIYDHLNRGGISILFTPNLDSLGFWKLKQESSLVMPVEHLYYFTPESMRRIVEKTGFEVLHYESRGMDIPDLYSYYRDKTDQHQVANFLEEHADALQAIVDASGHANHMRFIIKRPR